MTKSKRVIVEEEYWNILLSMAKTYESSTGKKLFSSKDRTRKAYELILERHPDIPRASIRRIISEANNKAFLESVINNHIQKGDYSASYT
tara:strand:- start:2901 stop:3170 length:270 start_codon:yes stop_codon:yes gene_type:complete